MKYRTGLGLFAVLVLVITVVVAGEHDAGDAVAEGGHATGPVSAEVLARGSQAREHALPLPSTLPLLDYEKILFPFVLSRDYATELGWIRDKKVRDTGPYIKGKYYGTHPAVRIYYSPKVMYWLTGNPDFWPEGKATGEAKPQAPREGEIPDGGMIIKEMFLPPAARYEDMTDEDITASLYTKTAPGWTVMIKEEDGAPDGWFWASVWKDQHYDTPDSLGYPEAGFGMACVRCHAVAAEKGTFSALRNIEGFPGDPLAFFVDETWRDIPPEMQPYTMTHGPDVPELQVAGARGPCVPNAEFLRTFDTMGKVCVEHVRMFPSEANDHVVADPNNIQPYLTSDQCMMCHSGANSRFAFGPIMFLETKLGGLNVSPYGEWRWSPMGLAGRDPVFFSQLESEMSMLKDMLGEEKGEFFGSQVVNTCLTCHGAMGKRTFDMDNGVAGEYWSQESVFDKDWVYITDPTDPRAKYAALARDGISCTVCHHQVEEYDSIGDFLANSITGQFKIGPPDEIYGPYEDVITKPMEHSTGLTPKYDPFIKSSRMCGTCHVINLPIVDWPLADPPSDDGPPQEEIDQLLASQKNPNFQGFRHNIEQATYLEWLNSKYQDEFGPKHDEQRTCQDCHMRKEWHSHDGSIRIDPIQTKIATIEDEDYPEADHRLPIEDITVKFREEGFRRHTFQGLNIFLLEMFRQFNDILGVRQMDFETASNGLDFAMYNYVQNARERSAKVEIVNYEAAGNQIVADVKVTNLTGHRMPSGVGFRRMFLEFLVFEKTGKRERVIWASGRTNDVGVLVDWDGKILPEEFFTEVEEDGKAAQRYHHHHQVIDSQSQVQVYEELAHNAERQFTTSFIRRAHHVKDNRLLPAGWTKDGPSPEIPAAFIHATHPGHGTHDDPAYSDGSGTDTVTYRVTLPDGFDAAKLSVRATLYSQAWAPYYLKDRFTNVPAGPEGEARRRLYYLTSHLVTEGTQIEDWKFKVQSASAPEAEEDAHPAAGHGDLPDAQEIEDAFEEDEDAGKGCG